MPAIQAIGGTPFAGQLTASGATPAEAVSLELLLNVPGEDDPIVRSAIGDGSAVDLTTRAVLEAGDGSGWASPVATVALALLAVWLVGGAYLGVRVVDRPEPAASTSAHPLPLTTTQAVGSSRFLLTHRASEPPLTQEYWSRMVDSVTRSRVSLIAIAVTSSTSSTAIRSAIVARCSLARPPKWSAMAAALSAGSRCTRWSRRKPLGATSWSRSRLSPSRCSEAAAMR